MEIVALEVLTHRIVLDSSAYYAKLCDVDGDPVTLDGDQFAGGDRAGNVLRHKILTETWKCTSAVTIKYLNPNNSGHKTSLAAPLFF